MREGSGLFVQPFGGDDEQRGCWVRGQLLLWQVLAVSIDAQFL